MSQNHITLNYPFQVNRHLQYLHNVKTASYSHNLLRISHFSLSKEKSRKKSHLLTVTKVRVFFRSSHGTKRIRYTCQRLAKHLSSFNDDDVYNILISLVESMLLTSTLLSQWFSLYTIYVLRWARYISVHSFKYIYKYT